MVYTGRGADIIEHLVSLLHRTFGHSTIKDSQPFANAREFADVVTSALANAVAAEAGELGDDVLTGVFNIRTTMRVSVLTRR